MMQGSTLPVSHKQRLWLIALVLLVYVFLLAPLLVTTVVSFSGSRSLTFPPESLSVRWYVDLFTNQEWRRPLLTSLLAAALTSIIVTPLAVLAAYGLRRIGGSSAGTMRVVLLLPQIVPIVLLAVGIFFIYAKLGLLNTMTGIVIVHCMFALPFALLPMTSAFESFDFDQIRAAQSLGAPEAAAFMTVVLPQMRAPILVSAMFAFSASLEEAVVSLLISGGETTLLSKRIFVSLRDQLQPTVAAVSAVMLALTMAGALLLLALRKVKPGAKHV